MKIWFGIVLAIITLQWWPSIPNVALLAVAVLVLTFLRKYISAYIIGFALGCLFASSAATWFQHKSNTAIGVSADVIIAGNVDSLFIPEKKQTRVIFDVDTVNGQKLNVLDRFTATLYWRTNETIKQGQRWQLTARLREPYGRLNDAGFDAETYYLARHIHAKGSVLSATLIENNTSVRQRFLDRVYANIADMKHARFLIALAFGDRALLTSDDWTALKNSGLAHLIAISGLHIGLAFFFGFTLSRYTLPLLSKKDNALYWPLIVGLLCAFAYAWVAGFSLTAQRALVALFVFIVIRQQGRSISPFTAFLLVLSVVLILDPFSVFSASFWLSFGAIFVLCVLRFFSPPLSDPPVTLARLLKRYVILLLKMQCFLIIGMLPIMLIWFNGISINALLFNLLAIPLISFVTVPLILLALLSSVFVEKNMFWGLADLSFIPLFELLNQVDGYWLSFVPTSLNCFIAFVLFAFFCSLGRWRQFPFLIAVVGLSLLFWGSANVPKTQWRVSVLDVGHGLAVIIERDGEAVLYDTGSAWKGSNSIAQRVIEPILRQRGLVLTGLIVSHSDNDHAGGALWVKENLRPAWVRTSKIDLHQACERGASWKWKNLHFEVLFPEKRVADPKNKDSCVVRVFDGTNGLLLTGDLPKAQEKWLVNAGNNLRSDVLVVPHHGSKSSSSPLFLNAVMPAVAIASTGRYTPWSLPHPDVVSRYTRRNIAWYETSRHGQISVYFSHEGWKVVSQRLDMSPFWYRKLSATTKHFKR